MTIASLTATQVSEGPWGGHASMLVAYVLWWVGLAWTFTTALVVLTVFFYMGNQVDRVMTPVLFMAPVSLATAGAEAGLITIYGFEMSSRLAVPMIVVGYFAIGIALWMAILLYTIYLHRLLAVGWPVPAKLAALFILVSTCIGVLMLVLTRADWCLRPTFHCISTAGRICIAIHAFCAIRSNVSSSTNTRNPMDAADCSNSRWRRNSIRDIVARLWLPVAAYSLYWYYRCCCEKTSNTFVDMVECHFPPSDIDNCVA